MCCWYCAAAAAGTVTELLVMCCWYCAAAAAGTVTDPLLLLELADVDHL
jgi:hypothetical protein